MTHHTMSECSYHRATSVLSETHTHTDNILLKQFVKTASKSVSLNFDNKDIIFCWVPSHNGIRGDEKGRLCCQVSLPSAKVGVPYNDFKYILFSWQDDWNDAVVKKLLSVNSLLKLIFNYFIKMQNYVSFA